jgi:5-methylcytosine-specific restriction enzyme subunit McrC
VNTNALQLREHTSTNSGEPFVESAAELWRHLRVSVTRVPGQDDWTLTAGSTVGFASVRRRVGVTAGVRVLPKIDALDMFFLADYAFGTRRPVQAPALDPALLMPQDRDPAAMLLLWLGGDINAFATRWLRRSYRPRHQVLEGEIRGEVLFDRYIAEHVPIGDAVSIPARVNERTLDTANNRLLKAGLRHAVALSHLLPVPAARVAVRRAVWAALPRFAQVADVRPTARNLRGVSARGPQRHYAAITRLVRDFLQGSLLGDTTGSTEVTAFTIDLPLLFQEALRGILADTKFVQLTSSRPRANIIGPSGTVLSSSKVDPDYVLRTSRPDGQPVLLLLDAKYKRAVETIPQNESDAMIVRLAQTQLRVKRADVYQATAYRRHKSWLGAKAALVYPVSMPDASSPPDVHRVEGFDGPVHLLFLDVGPHARSNLENFRNQISSLL